MVKDDGKYSKFHAGRGGGKEGHRAFFYWDNLLSYATPKVSQRI